MVPSFRKNRLPQSSGQKRRPSSINKRNVRHEIYKAVRINILLFSFFRCVIPVVLSDNKNKLNDIYRVSQEECARLRDGVRYVKVYRYNPKHLRPKLNGYGDKGARKVWSSCGSTYCTWFAWRNSHTLRIVRPCLQPVQARSSLRLHM